MRTLSLALALDIEHGYFPDRRWPGLQCVPSAQTEAGFQRRGLLVRPLSSGFELYATASDEPASNEPGAEGSTTGRMLLCIRPTGFDHLRFSDPCLSRPDAIAYCSPESGGGARDQQGRIRLHPGPQLAESDLVPRRSPQVAALLTPWAPSMQPALIVDLPMPCEPPGADAERAEPPHYLVSVGARRTYWTYYLLGAADDRHLGIVDLDAAVEFESLGAVSLSRDLRAQGFRSTTPIPLRQRSTCRFQLRETGAARERVLIRRLPVARPEHADRQAIGGSMAAISEIFING